MKKILALMLALAMVVACFAACSNSSAESSSAAQTSSDAAGSETASQADSTPAEPYKIGILAPPVTHGWVSGVTYYAEKRCQELKDAGEIEYQLITCETAEDMTNGIDDLKTWGAQAVVAYPQWTGMEEPIQALIDSGVYVVNFDIVIDCDGIYRVSGDNEDMGRQSAEYIVDKIGDTGTVIMLNVPSSGSVSELRQKGFEEKIAEIAPNLEVKTYATKFTREDGQKDFADILISNDHIDAVYSMDDETSMGVLTAIQEANRDDIKVVTGGGGCQEYFKLMPEYDDIWVQSALYSPAMVEDAVDNALALLKGETVEQVKIIPTTIVDRENCAEYLDESSPY